MVPDSTIELTGFSMHRSDRTKELTGKSRVGGVCFYINNSWCDERKLHSIKSFCSPGISYASVSTILATEGIYSNHNHDCFLSPSTNTDQALKELYGNISEQETAHPDAAFVVTGDFNKANFRTIASKYFPNTIQCWSDRSDAMLQDCFDHVDWDMFRAASDNDIEAYSDSVTCFIRKCIEDVVPTKTIRIYPNQNSDVRSALSARTFAFKSGNTDDRKQASYDLRKSIKAAKRQYKNKVEEQFNNNNARSMWQDINNITGFKGNKPATVKIAISLPDELNNFYARFEADYIAHTESAPAAATEEVSPLSLSVMDVTRSFKQHIISPGHQHRCSAGLHPQPTPVLPVHTRLYSHTQL